MENLTEYQLAWMAYAAGALGCTVATWWLFRGAGRAWVHFFVITVMVLLFTPFAIDAEQMTMAPALFNLVFGYFDGGLNSVKPIVKLMLGIWAAAQVLSLIYQLLTRHSSSRRAAAKHDRQAQAARGDSGRRAAHEPDYDPSDVLLSPSHRHSLSREERQARDELLREEPIRALR